MFPSHPRNNNHFTAAAAAEKMGAAHSRARPGAGPAKFARATHKPPGDPSVVGTSNYGYFILCIKATDRIKIVNASTPVLKMVTSVVRRHFTIIKSGWDRQMAYSFKLQKASRDALISLTAEILLTLYRLGWEPMMPIDLGVKKKGRGNAQNQTAICFRRDTPEPEPDENLSFYRDTPTPSLRNANFGESFDECMLSEHKECLCIETYGDNVLGFHEVPNILLYDLVRCVQQEWLPGLYGISNAVSSVISDYAVDTDFEVLPGDVVGDRRFIKLKGLPWSKGDEDMEDAICAENLVISIVACLARSQYKLQISIQMDPTTTVFFFIKDSGSRDVRLPTFCGVGLGEKNGLYVYRPTITRTATSFFRSR